MNRWNDSLNEVIVVESVRRIRSFTLHGNEKVEQYISESTHNPNVLKFLVWMCCSTHLFDFSWFNIDGPPDFRDDPTKSPSNSTICCQNVRN